MRFRRLRSLRFRRLRALGLGLALLFPASAFAMPEIREVDASNYPTIGATVVAPTKSAEPPALEENGEPVAGFSAQNLARAKSVMLAIDTSHSMRGQALVDATRAAREFLGTKPSDDRIALASFGSQARVDTTFSTGSIDADIALRGLSVDEEQGTALYDALVLSAQALASEPYPARIIILLTDGRDVSSAATLEAALAAARKVGAAVYPIGIEGGGFSPEALQEIARETGGTYYGAASSSALGAIYSSIAEELQRTWRLEYVSAALPGEQIRLVATAGGQSASAELRAPGAGVRPVEHPPPSRLLPVVLLESAWGPMVLALAIGLIVLTAGGLILKATQGSWVRARVDPHLADKAPDSTRRSDRERLAVAAALFRVTERALGQRRFWLRLQRKLERADLPLRTAEFAYVMAASGLALGILGAIGALPTLGVLGLIVGGATLPYVLVVLKARKRVKAFDSQLPDVLVTMAASLKAGHSFRQGMQAIVDEGADPASPEFKRVLTETQLGRSMEDSLAEMAARVGSEDFEFVINAVNIQRNVGGSLAGLFDMVAETVRSRQQFRRKVKGLTAMGRASAYVLIALPFFVAALITFVNSEYMAPLFNTSTGHKLIILTVAMMAVGSTILRKMVSFRG